MVSTRRQKSRADSRDSIAEFENSHADDLPRAEKKEQKTVDHNENSEASLEMERKENGSGSKNDDHGGRGDGNGTREEEVSNIFVIDRKGEEYSGDAASTSMEAGMKSKLVGRNKKQRRKRGGQKNNENKPKNPLSKLLPGYVAPMQLDTSSLDKYRPAGGMKDLQRRAERTDASTRGFVKEAIEPHADVMKSKATGPAVSSYNNAYSSFRKGAKRAPDKTAGDGWFGMVPTPMTEELKTDLAVIRNRNYLDPKKFYKSADKQGNIVQLGTVIEGPSEYFSGRLTKKQRRGNFTDEIMADPQSADYAKRKFRSMAQEKTREAQQRKRIHRPKRGKRFHT